MIYRLGPPLELRFYAWHGPAAVRLQARWNLLRYVLSTAASTREIED
jgi:hypothetical protein